MAEGRRFNWVALDRYLMRLGWSLRRLHEECGLDERNLRKIRDGGHQPRLVSVKLIAHALNRHGIQVEADDLWTFPDDPGARPAPPSAAPNPAPPGPAPNPFNPWATVLPPVFVGRTRALRDLEAAAWDGRGVSLLGEWRIGKTSLLHTWAARARELGFTVRLLSGQGRERQGHGALVDAVLAAGIDAAPDGQPAHPAQPAGADVGPPGAGPGPPALPESPDAAADRLGRWCAAERSASGGRPPLLLLDEAEGLLQNCEAGFLERLRGLLTDRSLSLVLATRRTLPEVYADLGRVSPFANMLESVRIGLLEDAAARQLIARGAAVWAPGDPEWLLEWAGRHPFYLTLLARRLFEARTEGAEADGTDQPPDVLGAALGRFRDETAQQFALWWAGLAERDRQDLQRIVSDEPAIMDYGLRRRGLLAEDHRPFARVLTEWLSRMD